MPPPGPQLPSFRYHPDPVATGAFEQARTTCRSCGEARGWVYAVAPYAETDLRDRLCPWCVADGSAAATFDAAFTDLGQLARTDDRTEVPTEVLDEIAHRTPGFSGWQEERWLFCCHDGAAFLGPVGWDELSPFPDAVSMVRAQAERWGFSGEDADALVGSLDVDGDSTAYLFRCLHCGAHLAYADMN